jgi:hypothetical protein
MHTKANVYGNKQHLSPCKMEHNKTIGVAQLVKVTNQLAGQQDMGWWIVEKKIPMIDGTL